MVETFETLLRTWSVAGRSVRPDHRMVAHSGFLTVARKVEPGFCMPAQDVQATTDEDRHEDADGKDQGHASSGGSDCDRRQRRHRRSGCKTFRR
jgi:tRNA (adenine57-N1/adenine58-N1)-methyltransferase